MSRTELLRELRAMVLDGNPSLAADLIHLEEDTGDDARQTAHLCASLTLALCGSLSEDAEDTQDDGVTSRTLELIAGDMRHLSGLCMGLAEELQRVARRAPKGPA